MEHHTRQNLHNRAHKCVALQPCRTVKIQVGDLVSSTMEFQLNVNSRASDLLAQFQRQSLRSPDNGKGKMRRYGPARALHDRDILTSMFTLRVVMVSLLSLSKLLFS